MLYLSMYNKPSLVMVCKRRWWKTSDYYHLVQLHALSLYHRKERRNCLSITLGMLCQDSWLSPTEQEEITEEIQTNSWRHHYRNFRRDHRRDSNFCLANKVASRLHTVSFSRPIVCESVCVCAQTCAITMNMLAGPLLFRRALIQTGEAKAFAKPSKDADIGLRWARCLLLPICALCIRQDVLQTGHWEAMTQEVGQG